MVHPVRRYFRSTPGCRGDGRCIDGRCMHYFLLSTLSPEERKGTVLCVVCAVCVVHECSLGVKSGSLSGIPQLHQFQRQHKQMIKLSTTSKDYRKYQKPQN